MPKNKTKQESSTKFISHSMATKSRSNSLVILERTGSGVVTIYQAAENIGAGNFSTVKVFRSSNNELLAVKSPLPHVQAKTDLQSKIQREADLFQQACPNAFVHLHRIPLTRRSKGDVKLEDYRLIAPYFDAVTLHDFCLAVIDPIDLKQVFLAIANKINEIHHNGVIHGDLGQANILINASSEGNFDAYIVDYGHASRVNEHAECTVQECKRWAPERTSLLSYRDRPMSHASQDVYSFGYMMKKILTNWLKLDRINLDNTKQFSSIYKFIDLALDAEPRRRPLLIDFIDTLRLELQHVCQSKDRIGFYDLYKAILKNNKEKVASVIIDDSSLLKAVDRRGLTPLHIASIKGQTDIVRVLVAQEADVNLQASIPWSNLNGVTSLALAAMQGHLTTANVLLELGANIHIGAEYGVLPIHFAVKEQQIEVFSALLEQDEQQLEATDNINCTPLMWAVVCGHKNMVAHCLGLHANPKIKFQDGKSALDLAREEGHEEIAQLLEQALKERASVHHIHTPRLGKN